MRTAQLGTTQIHLQGRLPLPGDRLVADFAIPPARMAAGPLLASDLRRGFVVVSTLPNIEKHACLAQIVELEERTHEWLPELRIVHVSADQESHWREVDRFHPNIRAAGYSLCCADPVSRKAFDSSLMRLQCQARGISVFDCLRSHNCLHAHQI